MAQPVEQDIARFSRPLCLPGVELVSVAYRNRAFPEHSHAEYVVGAVMAGAETLVARGRPHVVDAGKVLRLEPDEPHANETIGAEILRYQVLYLPAVAIRPFLDPADTRGLAFDSNVTGDARIFRAVTAAYAALSADGANPLEQESALAALVRALSGGARERTAIAPTATIARAKAYIDEHYADGFGLQTLAALTGLSVFHLVRSFRKSVGLSPLAYRNQRRVMEARGRLLAGEPVAGIALDMGYADQSHFTRQFQRIVGTSPRRYAQQ